MEINQAKIDEITDPQELAIRIAATRWLIDRKQNFTSRAQLRVLHVVLRKLYERRKQITPKIVET